MKPNKKKLQNAIVLLKQMAHPVRLSILCNLMHAGEMSVAEIVAAEGGAVSQSQISQFLAGMRADGLVKTRRAGQSVYYKLKSPAAEKLIEALYGIYCA
ncbi:MAG: metalloregulator ArsR/SmtB family transcription factor [Alphaproteobacteria bacterium]|nr:metalloregulator ArsR/SmtB family transcription factor [Alphaproteobacteria bacterium]